MAHRSRLATSMVGPGSRWFPGHFNSTIRLFNFSASVSLRKWGPLKIQWMFITLSVCSPFLIKPKYHVLGECWYSRYCSPITSQYITVWLVPINQSWTAFCIILLCMSHQYSVNFWKHICWFVVWNINSIWRAIFFWIFFLFFFWIFFLFFLVFVQAGREEGRKEGRKDGQEGRKEGRQAGRKEGRQAGRKEGRKEGRQAGRKEGRKEGRQAGRKEGRKYHVCFSYCVN